MPICAGHILVDGVDIAEVPVRDLRMRFAVVPQTPFLFEGSLRCLMKCFLPKYCSCFFLQFNFNQLSVISI